MAGKYAIGLDLGTNSVRALVVNVATGEELGSSVCLYHHGESGIILDPKDPNFARQHPRDYLDGTQKTVREAIAIAAKNKDFKPENVIGIGVDTTGSTPMPLDASGQPVAFSDTFRDDPNAMAWLWKDHTAYAEAEEITETAKKIRPQYLAKCGGKYSSEWFWSKILHARRVAPKMFEATHSWVEIADWIPAVLTGTDRLDAMRRGICAAGHKGLFHMEWGGYPEAELLTQLDPDLVRIRKSLPNRAYTIADAAGTLTSDWAKRLGLPQGVPVAVGALDAHLGAVGSGIQPGVLVKIIGTSTCDMMVAPLEKGLPDIPGMCGIVPESILPGYFGLEAGQSAVGDIFNWFVTVVQPGGPEIGSHEALTAAAAAMTPGASGLLGLDWHNGNRTVLVDQRLTGLLVGMTLHTTPGEIYRTLIESTAFGARAIVERIEEYGVKVKRVVNCGGISVKNPLLMQIYADILNRPMEISRSEQTCALGAAMAGAVVAGKDKGGHASFADAVDAMTGIRETRYPPKTAETAIYDQLFSLYKMLHDALGTRFGSGDLFPVMKGLLKIRDEVRSREGN